MQPVRPRSHWEPAPRQQSTTPSPSVTTLPRQPTARRPSVPAPKRPSRALTRWVTTPTPPAFRPWQLAVATVPAAAALQLQARSLLRWAVTRSQRAQIPWQLVVPHWPAMQLRQARPIPWPSARVPKPPTPTAWRLAKTPPRPWAHKPATPHSAWQRPRPPPVKSTSAIAPSPAWPPVSASRTPSTWPSCPR